VPTPRGAVAVLKVVAAVVFLLSLLHSTGRAQTSLNDIHVVPRQITPSVENAVTATTIVDGSLLHMVKTDVKLVLVPVSVTDPYQRLVSGLRAENFELFEGKKPQEIRHFSSEDLPVSIGIILDASGSMHEKWDRVREAVTKFCNVSNPQDEFFMIVFADQPRLATD
jgi:Ca-activated chloride channel family protein